MPEQNPTGTAGARYRQGHFAGVAGVAPRTRTRKPGAALPFDQAAEAEAENEALTVLIDEPIAPTSTTAPTLSEQTESSYEAETDVAKMRRMLKEKDHAIVRATLSAHDLEQQLSDEKQEALNLRKALELTREEGKPETPDGSVPAAAGKAHLSPETQAELDKHRREWAVLQRSLETQHNQRKAELATVRAQSFQIQQKLETESRARRLEAAQSSAAISRLERDLSQANTALSGSYLRPNKWSTGKRLTMVATICGICVLGAGALMERLSAGRVSAKTEVTAHTTEVSETKQVETEAAHLRKVLHAIPPASVSQVNFQGSLSRLNRALSSFANRAPQEVMTEVRDRFGDRSLCAFQWNNGQPAMIYGSEGIHASLGSALGRCAAAVEQLR